MKIDNIRVVKDLDRSLTSLEAKDKALALKNVRLELEKGDVAWLIFEIHNVGRSREVRIKDNFSELSDIVEEVYLIQGEKEISFSNNLKIKLPANTISTVAIRIAPNMHFNSVIKISGYIISLESTVKYMSEPFNFLVLMIVGLVIFLLIFAKVPVALLYLLIFLFSNIGVMFTKSFVDLGIINEDMKIIILNLLSILKYTILVQFSFMLFSRRYIKRLSLLLLVLQYATWAIFIIMLVSETNFKLLSTISYILSTIIVILFTSISFLKFYETGRRRTLALALSFCISTLFMLRKSFVMLGFEMFNLEFSKFVIWMPHFVLSLIVIFKIVKDRALDEAIYRNADLAFRAFKDSANLRETLSKFLLYSNYHLGFDSIHIFLSQDDSTSQFYTSVPNNTISSHKHFLSIIEEIPKNKIIISEDIKHDELFKGKNITKFYTSLLVIPLQFESQTVGNIFFASSKEFSFNKKNLSFAKELAYKCSIILHNYRQIELINMYNKKAQFEETVRLFQRNIAHDIKAPLRGLKTAINILQNMRKGDGQLEEYLDHMEGAVDSAMDQVKESISMIAEVDEEFDIEYLSSELGDLKKLCNMENIEIIEDIKVHEKFNGPRRSIRNMLRSIVKNAVEALEMLSKEGKKIKIKYYRNEEGKLVIQVRDNGIGFKPEVRQKVYEHNMISYGKKDGSGHGMMIARYIIDKLGGNLEIDSVENEYTIVTVTLNL